MVPTDYEWGQAVEATKALSHKLSNLRQATVLLDQENIELRLSVSALSSELQRLKVEIRTALSVLGFCVSAVAWVFR